MKRQRSNQEQETSGWKFFLQLVVLFVIVFGATLALTNFVVSKDRVTGTSMQPGLQDGDQLFSMRHRTPKRNDIVVVYAPDQASEKYMTANNATAADEQVKNGKLYVKGKEVPLKQHELYIKRVIGVAGDTVSAKNEKLYVNGKQVPQKYLSEKFSRQEINAYAKQYNIDEMTASTIKFTNDFNIATLKSTHRKTVPKGSYFVMGDNRFVSHDGRAFGFLKRKNIQSVVFWRFYPLNKMKTY
ncbi:signal peptidase I [Lacticaseibacillus pabuli]|uniref:Signal peptidase I n=1 Tax=Lacticaseibacillus pabuli TaxID=3025672 RepID=A0ABY7WV66_9LACO|nr:signal peptidase I [Lacticaseibacillus sp. KACC 23028]WDF82896.1 signal peptidase I [Lacticaseibacillus sp. KACC 23028]